MSHFEQKYVVEIRVTSSSGDGAMVEANLCERYEISGRRRAEIAEALRELADSLDSEDE